MGIQDRDYWRERYHGGVRETRDYSQQLRDLEAKGHRVDIPTDKPFHRRFRVLDEVRTSHALREPSAKSSGSYKVAFLLIFSVIGSLAFLVYKVVSATL